MAGEIKRLYFADGVDVTAGVPDALTGQIIADYLDFTHIATPGSPSAATLRVYAKADNILYAKTPGGVEIAIGSGSSGAGGGKNYILNPSAESDTSGWNIVGDLTLNRATVAAVLPRENTTGTGIEILANTGVQSTADYVYYDFTLDDVDLSKQLKIELAQRPSAAYVAGQLAVIITTQADRTTAIATPDITAIPNSTEVFYTGFFSTSTAAISLVIRATTDMTDNHGVVISDVVVGPWPTFANPLIRGLTVDGTVNEIQLKVQGHSTQTSNIFEVENSSAENFFAVDNNGISTLGSDTAATNRSLALRNNSSTRTTLDWYQGGTSRAIVGVSGGANDLVTGSAVGDLVVRTATSNILFTVDAGTTIKALIDTGGVFYANAGLRVPSTGGTATTWEHYEEHSHTTSWSGAISSTSGDLKIIRNGRQVTITCSFSTLFATSSSTATIATNTAILSRFRPLINFYSTCWVRDNGSDQSTPGAVVVATNGVITVQKNFTSNAFTNTGTAGFYGFSVTYTIN